MMHNFGNCPLGKWPCANIDICSENQNSQKLNDQVRVLEQPERSIKMHKTFLHMGLITATQTGPHT